MKNGGAVFPTQIISHYQDTKEGAEPVYVTNGGMTLRDYFAGQALAGLASLVPPCTESSAHYAYEYADAMLAEREKEQ